jgi:hypothetical protein
MGRLDDIAKRNAGAGVPYGAATKLVDSLPGGAAEPEAVRPFQLPSQRKRAVPVWKVLLLMLVIGAIVGVYTCRNMQRQHEWEEQHGIHADP